MFPMFMVNMPKHYEPVGWKRIAINDHRKNKRVAIRDCKTGRI